MRTKKALVNSSVNIIAFFIAFLPNLIIRKVFLDTLGSDMLGLSSLYTNIIGWLSIVEMGVGTAIIYSLYKPYAENDKGSIRAYIRFYGLVYRKIGLVILILGIIITPFLKYFVKDEINLSVVSMAFILYLLNSFITYIFSHKLCILNVAQEAYKLTIGSTISKLLIALFQFMMFNAYPSFILFITIQIIINVIYYVAINIYISKKYPWLNGGKEKLESREQNELLKNIKSMFMHKIGEVVLNSTDNIIISKFVGLKYLANYTNYLMVIAALQGIVAQGLNGLTASIGNMLISEDKSQVYEVHKKMFFINFWVVSFITISLYNTLNQFIVLWVGKEYLLNNLTFTIILINVYFTSMRGSIDEFKNASGNFYKDRYAPIFEGVINLVASVVLVNKIGIAGVFVGTLISNLTVIFWVKPYIVYKYVFNKKLIEYFKMYFKYAFIALIPLIVTNYATKSFKIEYSLGSFIINCTINIVVINIIYIVIFFKNNEFKYYINLLKKILFK